MSIPNLTAYVVLNPKLAGFGQQLQLSRYTSACESAFVGFWLFYPEIFCWENCILLKVLKLEDVHFSRFSSDIIFWQNCAAGHGACYSWDNHTCGWSECYHCLHDYTGAGDEGLSFHASGLINLLMAKLPLLIEEILLQVQFLETEQFQMAWSEIYVYGSDVIAR
jgi:hypothetical protein